MLYRKKMYSIFKKKCHTDFYFLAFFLLYKSLDIIKVRKEDAKLKTLNQYQSMGNRIKLRRKELHIKQSELAERLDISNNHISSIENGREKPSLDMFLKICEELKVTPDYLLLGNVHANNIPQNITEALSLCSEDDIKLASQIIELLVKRNRTSWNEKIFI